MCPCRLIDCDIMTTLVLDFDRQAGWAYMGAGVLQENSVPSAQFCSEHKTALKIKYIYENVAWTFLCTPTGAYVHQLIQGMPRK